MDDLKIGLCTILKKAGRVIAYSSRKSTPHEDNYVMHEL
jgi:hypothetical protein